MNKSILVLLTATLLIGCLKTRAELEAEETGRVLQKQTVSQQQAAQTQPSAVRVGGQAIKSQPGEQRSEELDEQMRSLNGRVETMEGIVQRMQTAEQQKKEAWIQDKQLEDKKLQAYEDAIRKLEAQVTALSEKVDKLETPPPAPEPPPAKEAKSSAGKAKGAYELGEELFAEKKWKDAARSYQKYRDQNAKGKNYADATYKIGVCFQELGLKDEAKAFLDEVVTKFPNTKEAKKAAFRLKSLK